MATRPLNSIKLAVREKASRISLVGRAVTAPTPDQDDADGGGSDDEEVRRLHSPAAPLRGLWCAGGRPGLPAWWNCRRCGSCATPGRQWPASLPLGPPVRASSIIPSNRPRIETPRRSASASTQARRSWSRRMPTTVDLEVAMTPLTVIRGVYISGAERWQPGGGHRGRRRLRIGSGTHPTMDRGPARHLRVRAAAGPSASDVADAGESARSGRRRAAERSGTTLRAAPPRMVGPPLAAHPCGHALEGASRGPRRSRSPGSGR